MKFTDTKIGMKIKRIGEDHKDVKKGSVYTIKEAHYGGVSLKGVGNYWYDLDLFEPVVMELEQSKDEPINKFEVGDEVLYKAENSRNYECTIFGIAKQKDKFDGEYAISFENGSGRKVNKIVKEKKLSPIKKKDELEVGDGAIFTNVIGEKYKVKIWGISNKADSIDGVKYGISINCEGRNKVFLVKEDRLSPLKKKDELDVGDKFKSNMGNKVEVLAVGKDGSETYFLGKLKMGVVAFGVDEIKEIIYD